MNIEIELLKSTTFAGRRFTRKQLVMIQQTVSTFSNLSYRELGHTLCENLNWLTPSGTHRIHTCLNALEEMAALGLFILPKKNKSIKKVQKKIQQTQQSVRPSEINGSLDDFLPISVKKVTQKKEIQLWNEFVDRYHYLGYKRPIGTHLRYFIISEKKEKLGCLIFSFPVWSLSWRDDWIGWNEKERKKHLKLILNNNRFLIFPWVTIKNLASKVLSLISKQVANDWYDVHHYRPVLLETFVDPQKYTGACYKAANWECIGKTKGKKGSSKQEAISSKEIYVYPLESNFRAVLMNTKKKQKATVAQTQSLETSDPFIILWQRIVNIVWAVSKDFDRQWQQRKRIINTMLLILFIFRLVFSKNKQGYGITIVELWEQCRLMNIPLPQKKPVAPSAFSNARKKLDESIFKELNTQIIKTYESDQSDQHWKGHRLFAVDGTKLNLPRQLLNNPYTLPSDNAYYPQGLVSCLYQLKSKIPYDFDLASHNNERTMALSHLNVLKKEDIVVYDRGYFSYAMLYYHLKSEVDVIFRLPKKSFKEIDEFFSLNVNDKIVTLEIPKSRYKEIRLKYPDIHFIPLKLRLIKYIYSDTTYVLGTTLLDNEKYKTHEFSHLYHARWGIEELYKISKILIDVEDFHGQSERGVKQELFSHFVLVTVNRIFTHQTEQDLNRNTKEETLVNGSTLNDKPMFKVNIKNALVTMARHLESLFIQQANLVTQTINQMIESISFCKQKERPGRKFERTSKKPVRKWKPSKNKPIVSTA
jgi:hypothetical protein